MNRISLFPILSLLMVLLTASCQTKPDFTANILKNQEKNSANYSFDPHSSLLSRVQSAPDFALKSLIEMDQATNYSVYSPTPREMDIIGRYFQLIPVRYQRLCQTNLIGIYFVKNLAGSGLTDFVLDKDRRLYTILYVNPDVLRYSISEWLTYRENTCFISNAGNIRIEVNCGTNYLALLYLFLHEISHVYDYNCFATPYIEPIIQSIYPERISPGTPFTKGIWKSLRLPEERFDFPWRTNVSIFGFNGKPKLFYSEAPQIYRDLLKTPFVSLYGSQSWSEDFADICMWYYLTKKLDVPYQIKVMQNSKTIFTDDPDLSEEVQARIPIIKNILD